MPIFFYGFTLATDWWAAQSHSIISDSSLLIVCMSILHDYYCNICNQFISSIEEELVTQQVQVEKQTETIKKDKWDELQTQVYKLEAKVFCCYN